MSLIVVVVLASLAGSFLCSLCESALYGVTPTQVEVLRRGRVRGSERVAKLRERIDEPIAGIAACNSLAQTFGAACVGALVGGAYGNLWMGIFSAVFSIAMLLFAEIVPKTIGLAWASVLAPQLAWPIQAMVWVVYPLAILCRWLSHTINRHAPGGHPTEEEVLIMADLAAQGGTILPDELRWVNNVLLLNNVTVQQLMTPRHVVFSLPAEHQLDSLPLLSEKLVHSRIPVTDGDNLDRVVGVVQRRAIFDHIVRDDGRVTLRELMRPALFVSEDSGGHQLLDRLMAERQHLAVVTNSSGNLVGVATLEDVLEYLLGTPIVGEHDSHPDMQHLARERKNFRGNQPDR